MTVTTGGRVIEPASTGTATAVAASVPAAGVAVSSPRASAMISSSVCATSSTSQPNSPARIFAVSASRVVLMCTPVMPMPRRRMRSSVALRLIFAAMPESVMFSSMRMTFLCSDISLVETLTGPRRIGCMPGRPRPPMPPRPIMPPGPRCWPGRMPGRATLAPARGSYCTRRCIALAGPPPMPVRGAFIGVGIGTPGRPAQYSTPVFGAVD